MKNSADIIVIGGGVIGSAVAYYLSKRGKSVLVAERQDTCSGSAGASGSLLTWFSTIPGFHMDLYLRSQEMFMTLSQELDADLGLMVDAGSLQVFANEAEKELAYQNIERNRVEGYEVFMLDIDETRKIEPEVSPDLLGAVWVPNTHFVDPIKLSFGYRRAARRHGASFFNETAVTGLIRSGGAVVGVTTPKGDYYADLVICCAGSWSRGVAAMAELDMPIIPRRGQMLVTEPVAPFCKSMITSSIYQAVVAFPELIQDETVKKYGYSFAVEQTETGTAIIYSTREFAGLDTGTTPDVIRLLAKGACEIVPKLKGLHFIRSFAGLRPYVPDELPIIGPVHSVPGFFMCSGHEGEGISLAPITGRLVSEMILDGDPSFNIDCCTPNRFIN